MAVVSAAVAAGLSQAAPVAAAPPVDDPLYPAQWNLAKVGAPQAWAHSTGAGALIGIVDTGVDLSQEDLIGKVVAGTSCVGSNGNPSACAGSPQDDNGHGTHVAGIAAAWTDNGKGVAGAAPAAHLVVAKVLGADGSGAVGDVAAGVEWVVDHGARVVNLSLGADMPSLAGVNGSSLGPAIEYAWQHGAVPVVAAGNTNLLGLSSSGYKNVDAVVVGASGPNDEMAPYSTPTGDAKWAVVAPGGDGRDPSGHPSCDGQAEGACIVSTYWTSSNPVTSYAYLQGTSMATPLVSGVVALLLSQGRTPSQAVQTLLATADPVPCGCAGRVDAARAVDAGPAQATASAPNRPAQARPAPTPPPSAEPAGPTAGAGTAAPAPPAPPAGPAPVADPPAAAVPPVVAAPPPESERLEPLPAAAGMRGPAGTGVGHVLTAILAIVLLVGVAAAGVAASWRRWLLRGGAGR